MHPSVWMTMRPRCASCWDEGGDLTLRGGGGTGPGRGDGCMEGASRTYVQRFPGGEGGP